ncbi:MAG: DUF523 domain-containing protein [Motiliproteus sp.]
MESILISSCLLGERVRYDGKTALCEHPLIKRWQQQQRLVPICPEMSGGLPCPRPAAEILGGQGDEVLSGETQVKTRQGHDVSNHFLRGAEKALSLCQQHHINIAILKARSPSCGSSNTYNGQFQGTLVDGQGVTAALLKSSGIRLFDENQLPQVEAYLQQLESDPEAGPC